MTANYLTQRRMEGESAQRDGSRRFWVGHGFQPCRSEPEKTRALAQRGTPSCVWDNVSTNRSDRDVFGHRAGRGDGIAVRAHAFQVKLNRLADEVFHFVQRFARSA